MWLKIKGKLRYEIIHIFRWKSCITHEKCRVNSIVRKGYRNRLFILSEKGSNFYLFRWNGIRCKNSVGSSCAEFRFRWRFTMKCGMDRRCLRFHFRRIWIQRAGVDAFVAFFHRGSIVLIDANHSDCRCQNEHNGCQGDPTDGWNFLQKRESHFELSE